MVFSYDASAGPLQTACRFTGTVTPVVMGRPEFWLFLGVHLSVVYFFHTGGIDSSSLFLSINWTDVKVIAAIATFFEVFYTNSCYRRYIHLYSAVMDLFDLGRHFLFDHRFHFLEGAKRECWTVHGWLLASIVLFFAEVGATNEDTDLAFGQLQAAGLLQPEEVELLKGVSNEERQLMLLQWIGQVVRETCPKVHAPGFLLKSQIDMLMKIRERQQEIKSTQDLPVPFQYFHMLCVMITINLLFWAYSMGTTYSIFAPLVFLCSMLIFMGMMVLAGELSDPFGEDAVDFPMKQWIGRFADEEFVLLGDVCPHHVGWGRMIENESDFRWDPKKVESCMEIEEDLRSTPAVPDSFLQRRPNSGSMPDFRGYAYEPLVGSS